MGNEEYAERLYCKALELRDLAHLSRDCRVAGCYESAARQFENAGEFFKKGNLFLACVMLDISYVALTQARAAEVLSLNSLALDRLCGQPKVI